jgi:hypothetical protein
MVKGQRAITGHVGNIKGISRSKYASSEIAE